MVEVFHTSITRHRKSIASTDLKLIAGMLYKKSTNLFEIEAIYKIQSGRQFKKLEWIDIKLSKLSKNDNTILRPLIDV